MHLLESGAPIEAGKDYVVAGWASVNEDVRRARRSGMSWRRICRRQAVSSPQPRKPSSSCAPAADGSRALLAQHRDLMLQRRTARGGRELMLTQVYIHLGVALAGLVSFLSPCVLPLVPPYLGYLGGTTIEQMTAARTASTRSAVAPRRAGLASSSCWGSPPCSSALGAGASVFGQWIQTYKSRARRSSPASSSSCSACTSWACCACRCSIARRAIHADIAGRQPGRRLCHGPRLCLRLDAVHRSGAGDRADAGGQRGEPRRRRAPAVRLFAGARHSVRAGGGCDRSVPGLPAALPPASAAASRWRWGCCWSRPAS